jgi:hypothetical protein
VDGKPSRRPKPLEPARAEEGAGLFPLHQGSTWHCYVTSQPRPATAPTPYLHGPHGEHTALFCSPPSCMPALRGNFHTENGQGRCLSLISTHARLHACHQARHSYNDSYRLENDRVAATL